MILVTGGAGFLGSHLVPRLAENAEVRVFELPTADCGHLEHPNVEIARGDVRDVASVRGAVRGCRQVYHLAGNPQLWTRRRSDFDAVNRQGTENVLHAALDAGAERVLFASTESILGTGSQRPSDESCDPRLEDMVGAYCRSKLLAERAAFALARAGAPVIVAAPTLPVGPGDRRRTPPTQMTVAFLRGELPAYLDCRFNMIDARDVAEGFLRAMERGRPGKRYLLGHRNLRLVEWLRIVGAVVGRQPPRWQAPYPVALAAAAFGEFVADWFTHRPPQATLTGVRLTRRNMFFDPAATLAELGLHPRPLEDSASDAVVWYREMGWL